MDGRREAPRQGGDELTQLWSLVQELTEQLAINQLAVQELKERLSNVKGQAAHVGAGFPLRRFNLDISDEEFRTELEKFASHLVLENQHLQHENKNLNALLKEYETTLEQVMGKFRGVAQHDLSLHSYYSSLLQTLQTAHSSAHLHDDTSLSVLLTRISTLLRSALRSLGGEEGDIDLAGLLSDSQLLNGSTSDGSSDGPPSPTKSVSSKKSAASLLTGIPGRSTARRTPFPGFVPGSSGGYAGTDGQGDWALEREMEILRLEEENKSLRDLLAIAEESPIAQIVGDELKEEETKSGAQSPDEEAQGKRKGSLTVEELAAGAEEEELEKERLIEEGIIDKDGNTLIEHEPGTGLGGGGGVMTGGQQRPMLHDSALGFTAEVAGGSAIDDGEADGDGEKDLELEHEEVAL